MSNLGPPLDPGFEKRICAHCDETENEHTIEKYPDLCPHCGEDAKWLTPRQWDDRHAQTL